MHVEMPGHTQLVRGARYTRSQQSDESRGAHRLPFLACTARVASSRPSSGRVVSLPSLSAVCSCCRLSTCRAAAGKISQSQHSAPAGGERPPAAAMAPLARGESNARARERASARARELSRRSAHISCWLKWCAHAVPRTGVTACRQPNDLDDTKTVA